MRYNEATKRKMELAASRGVHVAAVREGVPLEQEYKRLAKLADQRLRALEAYKHDKHFGGILSYSYKSALADIKYYSGEGAKRFDTAAPANRKTFERKINDILKFLNSPTSTKRGVLNMYKKRTATINERYGTNFTWQELAQYFNDNVGSDLAKKTNQTSATILKAIGVLQKKSAEIKKEIEESNATHKHVPDAEVNDYIYNSLAENGISLKDLIPGKSATGKKKSTKRKRK